MPLAGKGCDGASPRDENHPLSTPYKVASQVAALGIFLFLHRHLEDTQRPVTEEGPPETIIMAWSITVR